MKHLRRFGFALSVVAFGTGALIACGDDDAILLAEADSGADSANLDSSASKGKDVGTADAPVALEDAGSDATDDVTDASDDASDANEAKDVQADVEIVPVDSGAPDADAGDLAREFPGRVAAEICRTTARCCFGDEDTASGGAVDGGTYDQQKCTDLYFPNGFDQSNPGATVDFAKMTYDAAKASECLSRIHVLACGANAAEYRAVISACYAALRGTGGAGDPCKLSSECQTGFFCNTAVAAGTCEAIRASGDPCGDWTTNAGNSQYACSNRYSGQPSRYCAFRNDAGTLLPAADWKCNDSLPAGSRCSNDSWCDNSNVCAPSDGGTTCQGFISLFQPATCNAFVKK